jgi:hypothetical protein
MGTWAVDSIGKIMIRKTLISVALIFSFGIVSSFHGEKTHFP